MLLRRTWLMTALYPIVISIIVSKNKLIDYFISPKESLINVYETMSGLAIADIIILGGGFAGTIVSALVIKTLRKSGYQMF